jgi:hypothetical protein
MTSDRDRPAKRPEAGAEEGGDSRRALDSLRQSLRDGDLHAARELLERMGREARATGGEEETAYSPPPSPPAHEALRRELARRMDRTSLAARRGRSCAGGRPPQTLFEALGGGWAEYDRAGRSISAWRTAMDLPEAFGDWAGEVASELRGVLGGARQQFDELAASVGLCRLADAAPEEVLFVEACWTSAAGEQAPRPFLVGRLWLDGGRLACEQVLATAEDDEPACVQAFLDACEGRELLVAASGGRRGEVARLFARADALGLERPWSEPVALDLRGELRKRFGAEIGRGNLRTLHRRLRGLRRLGDVPASKVPALYDAWRDTADARPLARVCRHNAANLLRAAELTSALLTGRTAE